MDELTCAAAIAAQLAKDWSRDEYDIAARAGDITKRLFERAEAEGWVEYEEPAPSPPPAPLPTYAAPVPPPPRLRSPNRFDLDDEIPF